MTALKNLILEVHRRSIWQVLSIYLVGSWGALQVVEGVTQNAGLPDWVPPFALVLLVIGLPVVVATAFVQEGMPGSVQDREPAASRPPQESPAGGDAAPQSGERPAAEGDDTGDTLPSPALAAGGSLLSRGGLLTWRNAMAGGVLAFTLLGLLVGGYFLMRFTGIGPVASLAAQGVIDAGEPVVLAEFENASNDPTLGGVVTEALRVDLASSRALTLVAGSFVEEILDLMQAPGDQALTAEVAREVAVRGGITAVIDGEVGSAGSGYILSATLRSAETGDPLATFRRTAKSPDEVIDAIDGLSQDIRERAGESLRTIKAEAPLDQVTTTSLDALRLFAEAEEASELGGAARAKELLLEALALDPEFAMAWRKLSVVTQTAGGAPGDMQEAAARAYALRDRLTPRERWQAVAYYHNMVTGNTSAQIAAYEAILADYPDDAPALNNLAIQYHSRTRHDEAIALLERATSGPGRSAPAYTNLAAYYASAGRPDEAHATLDEMLRTYGDRRLWPTWVRWWTDAVNGAPADAHGHALEMVNMADIPEVWRASGMVLAQGVDAARGRFSEARRHLVEGMERERSRGELTGLELVVVNGALVDLYATGDSAYARSLLWDFMESDEFASMPGASHLWLELANVLTLAGEQDRLPEFFDLWSELVGPQAGTALSEARVAADAFAQPTNAQVLEALEAYRSQIGCPRCYGWQVAGLKEAEGDLEGAAQVYEAVLEAPFSSFYNEQPVARTLARERLGALYEELGDSSTAAGYYTAFAELWADADPQLQPRVRHARERAASLAGGS